MSILMKTEFLNDRIKVDYHLKRISGFPDETGSMEFFYSNIDSLEKLPENFKPRSGKGMKFASWLEEIYIPVVDKKIAFICESVPENSAGEREENFKGPYLIN